VLKETFERICSIPGVLGCFICDNRGRVVISSSPSDLEASALRDAAHEVIQTFATLARASGEVVDLDVACERVRLTARDLGIGILVVLSNPDVETVMLRLTLNVVAVQLGRGFELRTEFEGGGRVVLESDLDEVSWQLLRALERKEANDA
jgi:predicted regulator of Ras-like GTPase activity (Roadblock/LC7/MglB family)